MMAGDFAMTMEGIWRYVYSVELDEEEKLGYEKQGGKRIEKTAQCGNDIGSARLDLGRLEVKGVTKIIETPWAPRRDDTE